MITATKNISSTDTTVASKPIRVLLAAGGTGGHVYPAISIADAIMEKQPESKLLFVGTKDRMEWETVPKAGYAIKSVWISGFHRRLTPQNLLFPLKLTTSLVQSLSILIRFRPDVVVACGGFAAGPVGWVAGKMGIPVVLQEQNSYPGVTNRILAKNAHTIFTAFKAADDHFPAGKTKLTGNPIRSKLQPVSKEKAAAEFSLNPDKPVILILGGSGGALKINETIDNNIEVLHNDMGLQLIWQCGPGYYPELSKRISVADYPNMRLMDYINDMNSAYGTADLVVSRAGASTCSEIMAVGKASVLIPSPNVAGDHQTKNAEALAEHEAAILLPENEIENRFLNIVKELINDDEKRNRMSENALKLAKSNAAENIAESIFKIAEEKRNA